MKFRKDFVTNSSSSSYVCEICGRTDGGFEVGLSECEMMECVNGHIFCCDEALERPTKEEMIKMIMENAWNRRWDSGIQDYRNYTVEEISAEDSDVIFE